MEGIQLGQLPSHYITHTAVATVAKYDRTVVATVAKYDLCKQIATNGMLGAATASCGTGCQFPIWDRLGTSVQCISEAE